MFSSELTQENWGFGPRRRTDAEHTTVSEAGNPKQSTNNAMNGMSEKSTR